MASLLQDQANFLMNAIVTVDHSKIVLTMFIEQHLKNNHLTFEEFLNMNQHEIYHLFYDAKCCQCGPVPQRIKKKRILYASEMELLFDKNRQLSGHKTTRRSDFCCCYAKKSVTTAVLDFTLARCLLLNCCIDMFWYSCLYFKGVTFEQFLNSNKHILYHLWKNNTKCCKCQPDFIFPCNAPLIMESEWKKMFNSTLPPCENDRKRPANGANSICSTAATPNITVLEIHLELQNIILQYCSSTRKALDKLSELQNLTFMHVKKARMSYDDFINFISEAENAILEIAIVCGMEHHFRQILQDLRNKPVDNRMFCQDEKTGSESLLTKLNRMLPADFKKFILKGEYKSYENRVFLAGSCNVGKSCLAGILIGERIPKKWTSTNGLTIYFGRNGIDLKKRKMVTLAKSETSIIKKLLLGNPNIPRNIDEGAPNHRSTDLKPFNLKKSDQKQYVDENPKKSKDENPHVISMTENLQTSLPSSPMKLSEQTASSIQKDILDEIRTGEYNIEIAPCDLIDFGGQRCFDMTHQLFIQHKGTFVLMFDGRYELHTPLEEYPQGDITGKDILVHWVNSILAYCKEDDDILPMILFAATHSDCFDIWDQLGKEKNFKRELAQLFSTHAKKRHILYESIFFIDATNPEDLQIENLKDKLVHIAFQQSTWGQQMPIAWVPLELQMSEMRTQEVSVVQKEKVQELNKLNEEFTLTNNLVDEFLKIQHSQGKILYFNFPGLDNFIVVQPTFMVNILRSFITDQIFWPNQQDLRSILENIAKTGTVQKQHLFQLWSQSSLDHFLPTKQHKEYIIQVLVHLDILVLSKHENKAETNNPTYLVPCVVKHTLPVDMLPSEEEKTICLAYHLRECAITSALIFKLIATAIIVWPLKEIKGRPCLYFQAAILNIDDTNQLTIATKGQRIIIYLTNKVSRCFITPDVAASIQECFTTALHRVLHFYHECFGQMLSRLDVVSLLGKEVGFICNKETCLVPVESAKSKKTWRCNNHLMHDPKHCLYWFFDKLTDKCSNECRGLEAETLTLSPNDQHLMRIAKKIAINVFDQFIIHLGLTRTEWEDIEYQYYHNGTLGIKLMALYAWKKKKEICLQQTRFKDLSDALKEMNTPHSLCQIFREDTNLIGIASCTLQEIPSDKCLNSLTFNLGNCIIELGIELGLSFSSIQQTIYNHSKDMYSQLYDILRKWKQSSESRPTVLKLMKALQQTDSGGLSFLRKQYEHN